MKKISILLFLSIFSQAIYSQDYKVGDHELLAMPTAYTMPAGNAYFTDYELILLNYSYAISDRTHLGIFTLFPFTIDFIETFSIGVKQNYYQDENLAAAATLTLTPKNDFLTLGNVISYKFNKASFHLNLNYLKSYSSSENLAENDEILVGIGTKINTSKSIALIMEYYSSSEILSFKETGGLINLGLRISSEYFSSDIGFFRPIQNDMGDDFIAFPFLKFSYYFH